MIEKLTTHLRQSLLCAITIAHTKKRKQVHGMDILCSLYFEKESIARSIIDDFFPTEKIVAHMPKKLTEHSSIPSSALPTLTKEVRKIIEQATMYAFDLEHQYVGTEHVLLALLYHPDEHIKKFILSTQISKEEIKQALLTTLTGASKFYEIQKMISQEGLQQKESLSSSEDHNSIATPALDYFGKDLTNPRTIESLDPVIGRKKEIDRIITILARRKKNNPVLIGDPGVGKTAIIEGIAKRIIQGNVPEILLHKKIISLDLGLLVAGTMYRGEFESRLKQIVAEIEQDQECILFIDEIHMLVGAGGTQGSTMDAANILKPALASGAISCIGATTETEYKNSIETDGALDRRFQPVFIDEPSEKETAIILHGLKKQYEEYHHVTLSEEVIEKAIQWSVRFLPEQRLPDKTIDIIDEAGARAFMKRTIPQPIKVVHRLRRELRDVLQAKEEAIREDKLKNAVTYKKKEEQITKKIARARKEMRSVSIDTISLTEQDIARVISERTGIAQVHITSAEIERTRHLKKRLQKEIIGQDAAIEQVVNVLQRAATGLTSQEKPLGSFLFLGPSGVGKTMLAKKVAQEYFGDSNALIRINMSEFSESFMTSKLVGAPAGYVGHKEGTPFLDAIRKKPYAVILFDELEKAHPDMFQLLLQILDEGKMSDAAGKTIYFHHSIIMMTSNIGIEAFRAQAALGFEEENEPKKRAFEETTESILNELSEYFPQEFIGRIDKKIIFSPLSKKDIEHIVTREYAIVAKRAKEKGIDLHLEPAAKKHLAKISFHAEYGARHVRSTIEESVENLLAYHMVHGTIQSGDTAIIQYDPKKKKITLEKKKAA